MPLAHTMPLAHAGEEILYVIAPALVFLAVYLIRARRERRQAEREAGVGATSDGTCPYCGGPVEPMQERCPRCGFKIRREVGGA
jgi:hypothetical protein